MGERYPHSGQITSDKPLSYPRYGLKFAVIYMLLILFLGVVSMVFSLEIPGFLSMVVLLVSAMLLGILFYKEQRREPDKPETRRLTIAALGGSMAVTVLFLAVVALLDADSMAQFNQALDGQGAAVAVFAIALAIVLVLGISWLFISLGIKQGIRIAQNAAARRP